MKKGLGRFLFLVVFLWAYGLAVGHAQEGDASLGEIVVTGEKLITPTKQTNESVYTGTEVTRKGIQIQGNKADVSVNNAIEALPGVSLENVDPFGLSAEQKNTRIRGIRSYFGAMSVEGVPNWGGNPIGPRDYIYDTENFRGIAVYKGAAPASLGTGIGDLAGVIELRPLWPSEKPGGYFSTSFGTDAYIREFLRLDTGTIPTTGTRASASYSYTNADKWKGPGEQGPRNNFNVMVEQPAWGRDKVQFWFNYNHIEQDLFNALTYKQTRDLTANYRLDYNGNLTGIKSKDINYYKYNHADLTNTDLFLVIPFTLNDTYHASFKPYVSMEDSDVLQGATAQGGTIQQRLRDSKKYGFISEVSANFELIQATVGYLFEASDLSVNTKNYSPLGLSYLGWGNYAENLGFSFINSPYLKLAGKLWGLEWQAGVKYFEYSEGATLGYVWNARTSSLARAPLQDRDARDYGQFLPTVGLGYKFSDSLEIHGNYGENFIRTYSYQPLITLYNSNTATFEKAGVTLDDMFKGYTMTLSDDFDLGARYRMGWLETSPTLFYSKTRNLLVTVYDPRVKLNYQQNVGKATGYGFEIANNMYINDHLTLFVNPSYTSFKYDDDIPFGGATTHCKDQQVVDTPEWLVKSGVVLKHGGLEITPIVRYVGDRYGDIEHKEHVPDYFLADLEVAYTWKNVWMAKSVRACLQLQNIFDRKYVSAINASDDTRAGSTSYYVGAPFSAVMNVSMQF
jgi:iron complex outermembrane receptor protein